MIHERNWRREAANPPIKHMKKKDPNTDKCWCGCGKIPVSDTSNLAHALATHTPVNESSICEAKRIFTLVISCNDSGGIHVCEPFYSPAKALEKAEAFLGEEEIKREVAKGSLQHMLTVDRSGVNVYMDEQITISIFSKDM